MKKTLLYFCLLYSSVIIAQTGNTFHKVFTNQDGFDLDIVKAMNFDNDGFLWLGGENLDSRQIILSDKKLTLLRFNGSTFHNIPLPEFEKDIVNVNQIYKKGDRKFYIKAEVDPENSKHVLLDFDPYTLEYKKIIFFESNTSEYVMSKVFGYLNKDYILVQKEQNITLFNINHQLHSIPIFTFKAPFNNYVIGTYARVLPFEDFCVISDLNFPTQAFNWQGDHVKVFSEKLFTMDRNANLFHPWIDEVFVKDHITYLFIYNDPQLYYVDEELIEILPVHKTDSKIINDNLLALSDNFKNHLIISRHKERLNFNVLNNKTFVKAHENLNFVASKKVLAASNNLKNELWITMDNHELHYYKFPSEKIKNFLINKSIRSIQKLNSEEYLVATETKGWFVVNIIEDVVSPFNMVYKQEQLLPISSRNLIKEDHTIWSNDMNNIIKVDINTNAVIYKSSYRDPITCLEKLNDSIIVYGTSRNNLMQFNIHTQNHTPLLLTGPLWIYDIAIHNNLVVAATDKGMLTYNMLTKEDKLYTKSQTLEDPFILMVDYKETYGFLLGTRSGQIVAYNPETKSFSTLYKDKLKAGIATIIPNGDVWWINTFNGLVSFNLKSKTATRFSVKDGFSDNEANRYSALQTDNGMLVGTLNGLNYFNPNTLNKASINSQLKLSSIKYYNKETKNEHIELMPKNLNNLQTITLPVENRNLQLQFGLFGAFINDHITYRYRLDDTWVNLGSQNELNLINLAPGSYNLEIEALDIAQNKLGDSLKLFIDSNDFFYNSGWFYFLLMLGISGIWLWYILQLKSKHQLKEQFSKQLIYSQEVERSRIARELHDSIGQKLLILKNTLLLNNKTDTNEMLMVENSIQEVRGMSQNLHPFQFEKIGLTNSLINTIEKFQKTSEVFYSSDIDHVDGLLPKEQEIFVYRMLQECITNVEKHAQATACKLSAKKYPKYILFKIKDNGKGFNAAKGTEAIHSLGMKTLRERAQYINANLNIVSSLGKGTVITIKINKL